ncbi:hypothetical protein HMPREF0063_10198 [Aeromicrobium marinum DSM 15272]|uniref:Tyr recombinase domain-containing protein n=1 Tax=Aeromicrobium marinum DSM 15272 TaxID=585531 RepID=E2S841_9ACTN|nr:tyrosine-type recombinase/integrase [Aeromicrobium marinum]EFQ84346.1 hypothetical protein HMPREF0063_10198 [Aeromicrobium marinum DSM 15272]
MSRRIAVGNHGPVTTAPTTSGRWVARTRYRRIDGNVRARQATADTATAAEQALRRKLATSPNRPDVRLTGNSTICHLAAVWLETLRVRGKVTVETQAYYRKGVENLILAADGIGGYRITELRPIDISQFYTRMGASAGADGSLRRTPSRPVWAHKVLTQVLAHAVESGILHHNPARDVPAPGRNAPTLRTLSVEQLHEILNAAAAYDSRPIKSQPRSHRLHDVVTLLMRTGAELSELLALRWCDIDLDTTTPTVAFTGTLKPPSQGRPLRREERAPSRAAFRQVPIDSVSAAILRRLRQHAGTYDPETPVFATRNGTWLAPTNVRREWGQCRKDQSWDWADLTAVRKTVTNLIVDRSAAEAQSVGVPIAAAVLGRSPESISRRYIVEKLTLAPDVTTLIDRALQP